MSININIKQRKKSRRLALQAIYSWLLADNNWRELEQDYLQFNKDFDIEYFSLLIKNIIENFESLGILLTNYLDDKAFIELDPIEKVILIMAAWELQASLAVPYKVIINEAVELAKMFGATDSHKYVNGVLDKLAKELRKHESK